MFGSHGKPEGMDSFAPPVLESLEPRLLLTTIALDPIAGLTTSNFVYRNSQQDLVRVTLSNDQTGIGKVELLAWDGDLAPGSGGLVNIGGELDGTPIFGGISGISFTLDNLYPIWANPEDIQAIAYDPGTGGIWAYDNGDNELMEVSVANGLPTVTVVPVVSNLDPTFTYAVSAMDVRPTGVLYAVGTLVDTDPINPPALPTPAGPFLITIDTGTGVATQVSPGQTVLPAGTIYDIAFVGNTLYGTNGPNLLTINVASGAGAIGPAFVDVTNNNAPITNMIGLENHNGTIYGQAGVNVYTINTANGDCTPLNGVLSRPDTTDLTSDGTDLWGVYSSTDTRMYTININPPPDRDVFTLYVAEADQYTTLTFTLIAQGAGQPPAPLLNQIQLWSVSNYPSLLVANNAIAVRSPADSGGVLIGGVPTPIASNPFLHSAVTTAQPYLYNSGALGLFPGGAIHAGVMFAGPMGQVVRYEEWAIDPMTGEPTTYPPTVLNTDVGLGQSVSALAANSLGEFFAVDNVTHNLMQATYDPTANPVTTSTTIGQLVDATEPTFIYNNVFALDFDSGDALYGVANILDTIPGPPVPPGGTWLVTIDTATGEVTRVAQLSGATKLSTIAFDDSDTLYGVNADTNELVTIDLATGVVTTVAPITHINGAAMPAIQGLAFMDRLIPDPDPFAPPGSTILVSLHGVGGGVLFAIDPATGTAIPEGETGFEDLPALASEPFYPDVLWSVTYFGQSYRLVQVDPARAPQDFGRLLVGGLIAGQADISGSMEVLEMGFLWGNVNVRRDMGTVIIHTDASVDPLGAQVIPDDCIVHAEGTLHELDVYGTMYGAVDVRGTPNIPHPWDFAVDLNSIPQMELESRPAGGFPLVAWAEDGLLRTVINDTPADAQFLFSESGSVILQGNMQVALGDPVDVYAISLMAGQTVRLDGRAGWWDSYQDALLAGGWMTGALEVYDSAMNLVGTVGYETIEDWGVGSRGYTQEPLDFTAPRAGTYFLAATGPGLYTIFVVNGTSASLGAVHVGTDFIRSTFSATKREYDVAVSGGNLGAVEVVGSATMVWTHVFGGGDLVSWRGGDIGTTGDCLMISHGNVGSVESTVGAVNAVVVAGAEKGKYNKDAHIQNVIAATDLDSALDVYSDPSDTSYTISGLWASGSIGSVFVGGSVTSFVEITINGDDVGPTGYLDLLDVRGDWLYPALYHGVNADIRMVRVGGTILVDFGGWVGPLEPVKYDNGTVSVIDDDGGGKIKISPSILVDATGAPVLVPDPTDPTGLRMMTVPTPYEYYVIPVMPLDIFGKTGSVLVNLVMNGPGTISVNPLDVSHIGNLQATGPGTVTLSGNGALSVFHLEASALTSFVNNTRGNLLSANINGGIESIDLKGSIGRTIGATGQWLWGLNAAPAGSQMGWFFGTINGVVVNGDITDHLAVGGWLGDLLVTGRAENIRVNSDGLTAAGTFDGVVGVVHVGSLNEINVGDGLADDGPGDAAMAAILSEAEIERVLIDGPGRVLNGSVLAIDYITEVIGRNGAIDTAIIASAGLDSYQCWMAGFVTQSYVGRVDFSGPGAVIDGSEVYAIYIGTISASVDSDGIRNSFFTGAFAPVNQLAIERILAGGPGMFNTTVGGNGAPIGVIRGVGGVADIQYNIINGTDDLNELSGRDVFGNYITIPGTVGLMKADRDIFGNTSVHVGAITRLVTGRHFAGNYFTIAAELKSARIGARFSESILDFQGPYAILGTLDVEKDISGKILSAGEIGSVITRTGAISADIETVANTTSGNVGLISTVGGYSGALDVAGNLYKFVSYSTLGVNPTTVTNFVPKRFNIAGDLGQLTVDSGRGGAPVHLYTTLYVGGSAGSVAVDGSLYADLLVNGSLGKLTLAGDMGGTFSIPAPTVLGNLVVLGELGRLSIPASASIVGDMTIGGSIKQIKLSDKAGLPGLGNIEGDITSLYGSIAGVSLTNGALSGTLTAAGGIGKISVRGTAADPANITGDIVARGGGIAGIDIRGGSLDASVSALAGGIGKISIRDGDAITGHSIYTVGRIKALSVLNGDLGADVVAEGGLDKLDVRGSDLTGDLTLGGDVKSIRVDGDVNGSTVWVAGLVQSFSAGSLTGAVVSSLFGMDKVDVAGNVSNSRIVGGYNADTGELHSAYIQSIMVGGNWTSSVVAVGVDPVDGDFTTDPNLPAPGLSGLGVLEVGGSIGGAGNRVVADTWTGELPAGMPRARVDLPAPALSGDPANRFGEGTTTIGGVTITLKGPGAGSFDPATDELIVVNTTDKTGLSLSNPAAARTIRFVAGDDDSLSAFSLQGSLTLGDTDFDGAIGKLAAAAVASGASMTLAGGVGTMSTGGVADATLVVGALGQWNIAGGFLAGSLTADAITKGVSVAGNMGAALTTVAGGIAKLAVSGALSGDVTARNGLGQLTAGAVSGNVVVENGDLGSMQVNGNLAADVDVQRGYLGRLDIRGGSFSSPLSDNAIRALTGIGQYSLSGGVSNGLISTGGAIGKIKVSSTMQSRVRAENGIGSVDVDLLTDALLSSGTSIGKVNVRGDMVRSDIVAGMDPSDGGYDPLAGGEAANVRFDGRTFPASWRTAGNLDKLNGGDVGSVAVRGDMIASSIAAGVGPGADGWYGTPDDQARGSGYVRKVRLGGSGIGSADPTEHYGIYAASAMPNVSGPGLFFPQGNFDIGSLKASSGSPRVLAVKVLDDRVQVFFDHDLDFSTINTAQRDAARPTTFQLIVSRNGVFGPGESDDVSVSDAVPSRVTYDSATNSVILTLVGQTWLSLNLGTHFQLTVDGSVVSDRRGNLLDGEYGNLFPTGNGLPGGDFVYYFVQGDAGPDQATATDLSNVVPMNQSYAINGELGDIPGPPASDVDVYQIALSEGDVFYWYTPSTFSVSLADTAALAPTNTPLGARGMRAGQDGFVYLTVSTFFFTGPYTIYVERFNDGNSNFNFDDSTQDATALSWVNNVAQPTVAQQQIVAPDDVDLYSLGNLPANTQLTVSLETILIGSPLRPKMAVFNSAGDLLGNIMFGDDPDSPDVGTIVPPITLSGTVITPADDTYYVAVAGMGFASSTNFLTYDMGKYRLSVTRESVPAPVYLKQVVYLNFTGGVADYLTTSFTGFPGVVPTYQSPISAAQFGFKASDTQTMLNTIVSTVQAVYAGFTNIEFTTVKPLTGPYTTVFVGGNVGVFPGLLGIAEKIDSFNRDRADDAVVFGGEYALYYNAAGGYTLDEIGLALGNTSAHELGHILGLNHVMVTTDNWLMAYGDDFSPTLLTTHAPLMYTPSYEFIIGYQNSVASLAPVA